MDAQAQDRCHRIGQTRDVHIYRLVSSNTVEENILKKANQKRQLAGLAIESGAFTTDFFDDKLSSLFDGENVEVNVPERSETPGGSGRSSEQEMRIAMLDAEDEEDRKAAAVVQHEITQEGAEFDESKPLRYAFALICTLFAAESRISMTEYISQSL